jgi:hypothetical protein
MPLLPSLPVVPPAFKLFGSHPHRRVDRHSRKSQSNCVNLFVKKLQQHADKPCLSATNDDNTSLDRM